MTIQSSSDWSELEAKAQRAESPEHSLTCPCCQAEYSRLDSPAEYARLLAMRQAGANPSHASLASEIARLREEKGLLLAGCKTALLAFETMIKFESSKQLCDPGQMALIRGAIKFAEGER